MSEAFGSTYADIYDALYHDKDYAAECDLIEHLFQTYGDGAIGSVLDLGCGTGNHAIPLAERGYHVVGVDRSEVMLAKGQRKAANLSGTSVVEFRLGDLREVSLDRTFDAALMMFAVLGYGLENADVAAALTTARNHLRPGGLLVFDVWYGPAVLNERPSQRVKITPTEHGRILRVSSGTLDIRHHRCSVHIDVWELEGDRMVRETNETHQMRYFFPLEIAFFLETAGFSLLRLGQFPNIDSDPNDTNWNIIVISNRI